MAAPSCNPDYIARTQCLAPVQLIDSDGSFGFRVPCGKCPGCRRRRISAWSVRLTKQAEVSTSALFITLTYDTKHVPITENGYMNLSKRDLQLFFKRLRKYYSDRGDHRKIKYYAVGEYGGQRNRPHYHVILFNADQEGILHAWKAGHIHFGNVTMKSAGYTLKYINKEKHRKYGRDDRIWQFSVMSKGLGANYLTDAVRRWHTEDLENRCYYPMKDGHKAPLPRYYRDRLYNEEQKMRLREHFEQLAYEKERDWKVAHPDEYLSNWLGQIYLQELQKMHEKESKRQSQSIWG